MRRLFLLSILILAPSVFAQNPNRQVFFTATENPISQSGIWLNGLLNGLNASNVRSNGSYAFGTQVGCTPNPPTCPFNDSSASLTGVWGNTQTMYGMVHLNRPTDNSQEEVELRLRLTISPNNLPGYEMQFGGNKITPSLCYTDIVRWRGGNPLVFDSLDYDQSPSYCLHDRDIIKATVSGSTPSITLTEYICPVASNYVCTQVKQVLDTNQDGASGINSGNPGIGFYFEQDSDPGSSNSDFGFYEVYATDNTAPGTIVAASTAQLDVQGAVTQTSATGGDAVQIPCSGTQSATWTGTVASSNNLSLTALGATSNSGTLTWGAGTNCLTIIANNTSGPMFAFTPSYQAGQAVVLQDMNIDPVVGGTALWSPVEVGGTCTGSGCPSFREDNVIFGLARQWSESGNCGGTSQCDAMNRLDNVFGVLDHNTLPTGSAVVFANINHSAYLGVGAFGDNSWAQPDSFGTANNMFLENNLIQYSNVSVTDAEFAPIGGGIGGGRQVDRYNHITSNNGFGTFGYHGLDTDGRPRSGREIEVYGNSIACIFSSCNVVTGYRGGTGYTFGNNLTAIPGTSFWSGVWSLTVYRIVDTNNPFNGCGGLNSIDPVDTNDNTVYFSGTATASGGLTMTDGSKNFGNLTPIGAPYSVYDVTQNFFSEVVSNTATTITINPHIHSSWTGINNNDTYQIIRATSCADQGGNGQGNLLSGATPSTTNGEVLDPIYEWNDSINSVTSSMSNNGGSNTKRTIPGHNYYTDGINQQAQTSPTFPFNATNDSEAVSSWSCGGATCLINIPSTTNFVVNGYVLVDNTLQGAHEAPNGAYVISSKTTSQLTIPNILGFTDSAGSGGAATTVGMGYGVVANRPTTCSPTVGYFASDVGPQGTLYRCLTTNVWTATYAPYTYPHPLAATVVVTPTVSTPAAYVLEITRNGDPQYEASRFDRCSVFIPLCITSKRPESFDDAWLDRLHAGVVRFDADRDLQRVSRDNGRSGGSAAN